MTDPSAAQMAQAREAFKTRLLLLKGAGHLDKIGSLLSDEQIDGLLWDAWHLVERHQGPDEPCPQHWTTTISPGVGVTPKPSTHYNHPQTCRCNGTGEVPGRVWPNEETYKVWAYYIEEPAQKMSLSQAIADAEGMRALWAEWAGNVSEWRVDWEALRYALREG